MPFAEIAAALSSLKTAAISPRRWLMLPMRLTAPPYPSIFKGRSWRLRSAQSMPARLHAAQIDRIRDLEAEVARLKDWEAEKATYELKGLARGVVGYMLKPEARGSQPPHWLCPNCYGRGQKSFFQLKSGTVFTCQTCGTEFVAQTKTPMWID